MGTWTVIDEQHAITVESGDTLALDPAVLGWEAKPQGLCRDDVCIPLPAGVDGRALDPSALGRLLGRPVVVDAGERVAAFAAPAAERAAALRSGLAPDFELPDIDGVMHRLSQYRGRKVVLYAYGSW
jgi:hypothetical protein